MSLSFQEGAKYSLPASDYVSDENIVLQTCKYCSRRFFSKSLLKHQNACERSWIKKHCTKSEKKEERKQPPVSQHITGFIFNIKSMADMLALGEDRRNRWRWRHEEFKHVVMSSRAAKQQENGQPSIIVEPLSADAMSAGLIACETCGRTFNEAAIGKHQEFCKENSQTVTLDQTEEQIEAKTRFMKRMNYKQGTLNSSPSVVLNIDHTSEIQAPTSACVNSTYFSLEDQQLVQQLTDDFYRNPPFVLSKEVLNSEIFSKFLHDNIFSMLPHTLPANLLQVSNCNKSGLDIPKANEITRSSSVTPNKTPNFMQLSANYSSPSAVSSISSLSLLTPILESSNSTVESISPSPTILSSTSRTSGDLSRHSHHKSSEFLTDGVHSKHHHSHSRQNQENSVKYLQSRRSTCKQMESVGDNQVRGDDQYEINSSKSSVTSSTCRHKAKKCSQHHSHFQRQHRHHGSSHNKISEQTTPTTTEDGEGSDMTLTAKTLDSTVAISLHQARDSFVSKVTKQTFDGDNESSLIYYQSQPKHNENYLKSEIASKQIISPPENSRKSVCLTLNGVQRKCNCRLASEHELCLTDIDKMKPDKNVSLDSNYSIYPVRDSSYSKRDLSNLPSYSHQQKSQHEKLSSKSCYLNTCSHQPSIRGHSLSKHLKFFQLENSQLQSTSSSKSSLAASIFCHQCGSRITKEARFCASCGTSLMKESATSSCATNDAFNNVNSIHRNANFNLIS